MNDNTKTDEYIRTTLTTAFPEREIEELRPAGPSWNDLNETVRVEFGGSQVVFLKIAVDGDGSRITRECAVIDYVGAHCDVGVPTVIANEPSNDPPYLVTAPMREQSLAQQWADLTKPEHATVLRQIGTALADIHSQEFEQHGHIARSKPRRPASSAESLPSVGIRNVSNVIGD
jgi:fructosamine-3-kinase